MRELPILFSTPMVQAILEEIKIMTRRTKGLEIINGHPDLYYLLGFKSETNSFVFKITVNVMEIPDIHITPQYQIGDKIYVCEKFEIETDGTVKFYAGNIEVENNTAYRELTKWKPSIHMSKSAARIWLECTGVRCERLHDISEDDAKAEGILSKTDEIYHYPVYRIYYKAENNWWSSNPVESFSSLWEMINGEDSWIMNPYVFVYEFKRIEKP